VLVDNATTYEQIATILPNNQKWVVKPDQLFGKRGKYGLVGVRLDGT
jgi:succinyl-CoA synthetase beta subunit